MASERLKPTVEIESATAADILGGLEALAGRIRTRGAGQGVMVRAPGEGPDRLMNWALQEVNNAMQSTSNEEREHHCVDAVLHARRALSCLVDWYLERDLATFCKDAPSNSKQKVRFLISRGIIDELTSRVLERAIRKRNDTEHRYISPTLEVAEDVVELIRRTLSAIRTQSAPEYGPWIFGSFLHSLQFGEKRYAEFHGWSGPLVVFSRFEPQPWVGLVLPENKTKAVSRRALLKETTTDELVELLLLAARYFGAPSSYADTESCRVLALSQVWGKT
ncbi:MAG: hypothetical protein DME99_06645 [Verrucomicrobia bacterium]|nr:MAG: hypothetical protein DME99_06645 [Verrucomicrobiota bacterium]